MGVRQDIVACARSHIGDSYNYGASYPRTGPASDYDSFNCSGLTRAVYEECGLTIPGWQGHQNGNGSQSDWVRWHDHWVTDPEQLKPGDLVFFSGTGDPDVTGHVGISLGCWDMIDSVPDGGVQERTLYDSFVGGGWPLPDLPDSDATGGVARDGWRLIPAKGAVEFDRSMNIRTAPSTDAPRVVDEDGNPITYEAGETLNVDGFVLANGYTWAHYIGGSGKDRFVALSGDVQFAKAVD